jgi:hypothetical protein
MDDERIQTRWFQVSELKRMIHTGRIIDGKTIVGVLAWLGSSAARARG